MSHNLGSITSYVQGQQLLDAQGSRLGDNRHLFDNLSPSHRHPSIAYRMSDGSGVILHYNGGKGYITRHATWETAHSRVCGDKPRGFMRRRY